MLAVAKRSPAYRTVRDRVTRPYPSDAWYEEGLAILVFDLLPSDQASSDGVKLTPQVVFVVTATSRALVAAKVVEPDLSGRGVLAYDLLGEDPSSAEEVPL